ncbi:hypothetical protein [Paenibacillus wynnii]|uniref:hypothetical protein n=1 Tax=Paenibacillus wynnii TaxID=268407 RepID=UPI00068D970D|nr:hypothetical protein [Paenibacillus wynnii]
MRGAFQTSREIFENPIWQDIPKFRIFFYIVGNAVFAEEGITISGVHVKRGQYLRAYRNLSKDLEYVENRSIKRYSISVISRKVEQLVKEERLKIEDSELGTLFTVVNYAMYQGFEHYKKGTWNSVGTELERTENGDGTELEQGWNNNKKDNKDINVKKERIKDSSTRKNAKRVYSEDDRVYKLAKRFHELAYENAVDLGTSHLIKNANFQKWSDTFRLILERDKIPESELGEVIKYALAEQFYRTIILSPANLREHYPKILTHMRVQQKIRRTGGAPSGKPHLPVVEPGGGTESSPEELAAAMEYAKKIKEAKNQGGTR